MAHVLIVGAGPAGASLAHVLSDRGIEVTLLERQRDFSREFRGEVLNTPGILACEQMGLGGCIEAVPHTTQETFGLYMNGRLLVEGPFDPAFFHGKPPTAVSQPALLEAFVAEAAKSQHFRFERGASVKDLLVEDDRVVGVRARTEDGERQLRADLVIGADGRASIVRKRLAMGTSRSDPPMDIVWCKLPRPEGWDGVRGYLGRGHLLVAYRCWDDSLQLGWVILKGTFGELRSRGAEQWVEEMADHVAPDLGAHLRAHAEAVRNPFLLDTVSDCVVSWSAKGALLLGDAAHTMSPVAGQGLNIALRDAIAAANELVPVLCEPTPDRARLDAALKAIEAERMKEVAPIQTMQAQPPKVILNRSWWGEPVRRTLAALLRRPLVQRRAVGQVGQFAFGATELELRV